jgi:putative transposase
MTKPDQHSAQALFRFGVIAKILARIHAGSSRAHAIESVSSEQHILSNGSTKRVRPRSLYRWLAAYESHGTLGLEPKARSKPGSAGRVLPQTFIDFLVAEKYRDRAASVPELIRRAGQRGILKVAGAVDRSTVYRTCKRLGLPLARCRHAKDRDSRRFAYPHRMDMVLCDGKHFRVGAMRRKRVALFFIDDATRLVIGVVVGTGETKELFLRGLYQCIHRYGLMTTVFVDNGPGFIANDSLTIFARLGILLVHGERCYKEGHGKVERFNRTIKADVLRGLDGHPDVDSDCGALELRLAHYIEHVYARRPHESLDGQAPQKRFDKDPKVLRFPSADKDLRRQFEVDIERHVSNDHVISIDGVDYEVPRGCASRKITVRRRLLEDSIVYTHLGKVIELHPVDLAANAQARRAKDFTPSADDESSGPPTTAAQSAFHTTFKPVVDEAGGFIGESPSTDDQQLNDQQDQEQTS